MLFSAIAVNLNKVGFNFTTDQLFMLTALPSLPAILRVPYSFMVPIFGGRYWTVLSTVILIVPCVWLGIAIQNTATPYWIFIVIALLCGFAGANFASSMGNISFFFPKAKQGSALGINGGLGNLGVSVMQLVAPLVIFLPMFTFLGVDGVPQDDGSTMWLATRPGYGRRFLLLATIRPPSARLSAFPPALPCCRKPSFRTSTSCSPSLARLSARWRVRRAG
jgi:NNP family nitrate/nitrite transporter-like MFS transporter